MIIAKMILVIEHVALDIPRRVIPKSGVVEVCQLVKDHVEVPLRAYI